MTQVASLPRPTHQATLSQSATKAVKTTPTADLSSISLLHNLTKIKGKRESSPSAKRSPRVSTTPPPTQVLSLSTLGSRTLFSLKTAAGLQALTAALEAVGLWPSRYSARLRLPTGSTITPNNMRDIVISSIIPLPLDSSWYTTFSRSKGFRGLRVLSFAPVAAFRFKQLIRKDYTYMI